MANAADGSNTVSMNSTIQTSPQHYNHYNVGGGSRHFNYNPDRFAVHLPSSTKNNVMAHGGSKGRS